MPSYYTKYGGFFVSGAIGKYMHVMINKRFEEGFRVSYSVTELTKTIDEIKHPVVREALRKTRVDGHVEIVSIADAPASTGLGSSGSFCVGLLNVLYAYNGIHKPPGEIAEEACDIAMNVLKEPSGKQDEYVASFGGIRAYEVDRRGKVKVRDMKLDEEIISELEHNLLMFYTGIKRDARHILGEQQRRILAGGVRKELADGPKDDPEDAVERMHRIKRIGMESARALEKGDLRRFGELLHEHWTVKRGITSSMSNDRIDRWYSIAKENGAIGGKLCFAPGTLVSTETGYRPIEEILPGDRVYDHRNQLQYVRRVLKRNYEGPILEFRVRGLDNKLVVTPEHPIMTTIKHPLNKSEGRKVINLALFKPAREFRQGDVFLIPVDETVQDVECIDYPYKVMNPKYSNHGVHEGFPSRIPVNRDFLNLLGWFVAEGSRSLVENLANTFSNRAVVVNLGTNSIVLRRSSAVISGLMADLCGYDATGRHLPEFVMKLPKEKQFIVLRALWCGDGCVRKAYDKRTGHLSIRCSYKTTSFTLARQVQRLCMRLGFMCSLRSEQHRQKRIYRNRLVSKPHIVYAIDIYGEDAVAFRESLIQGRVIPVVGKNRRKLSPREEFVRIDGVVYAKASVLGVEEKEYDGEVYNLEVEDSHTYVVEGVAVHNCGAGGGGFLVFYCEDKKHELRKTLAREGLEEHRFRFDFEGSKIIYNV